MRHPSKTKAFKTGALVWRRTFSSRRKSDVSQPSGPSGFCGRLSCSSPSVISYTNVNARFKSAGLAGMGASKWHGMTLLKSHSLQMLSTHRRACKREHSSALGPSRLCLHHGKECINMDVHALGTHRDACAGYRILGRRNRDGGIGSLRNT